MRNRYLVYHDTHLVDTFFDAGGDNNFGAVASSVVSRWLWAAFYLPAFGAVYLVQPFCPFLLYSIFRNPNPDPDSDKIQRGYNATYSNAM